MLAALLVYALLVQSSVESVHNLETDLCQNLFQAKQWTAVHETSRAEHGHGKICFI